MNNHNKNNGATGSGSTTIPLIQQVKVDVHRRLLETLDLVAARKMSPEKLHEECSHRVDMLLNEQHCPLSGPEKQQLLYELMDEIFGLGPIEELLRDPTISDILVNGPNTIYIERDGLLKPTDVSFRDVDHLMQVIQRIAALVGRRIDESSPMLDARLLDGSRVNAIIPPLSLDGPALSIRRFGTCPIQINGLIEYGTMTKEIAVFLKACVQARINILISGGTGAGKTTLLNAMSQWIPAEHRVVTIEDTAELQLQRDHVVRLETRPANIENKGLVTQRDLLRNSLRMRPDRIIIGEVRGSETFDMLQAMNTGHEGSMTTIHANGPRDAMRRVENMVSMAGLNYPIHAIRQQTASALNLLIHLDRITGGGRKVMHVSEIVGMEGDVITLHDLFLFVQTGIGKDGRAEGYFECCGVLPRLLPRLASEGLKLPEGLFRRRKLTTENTKASKKA